MPNRLTIKQVKSRLKSIGYHLVDDHIEYVNAQQPLKVMCTQGHERIFFLRRLSKHQRCAKCIAVGRRASLKDIKYQLAQEGYSYLSDTYTNANTKITLECPNKHEWKTTIHKFKSGRRCPTCTSGSSRAEKELMAAIHKFYPSAKKSKLRNIQVKGRPYIKGFDIDIYVPELHKGIEFDGRYWHSFNAMKRSNGRNAWPDTAIKNYHQIKDSYFNSIGITLFHVKEEVWLINKEKCIKACLTFLRSNDNLNIYG